MESYKFPTNSPEEKAGFPIDNQSTILSNSGLSPLELDTNTVDQRQWLLLQRSNAEALSCFYQRYGKMLHNYGYRLVPDKELVKDTVQDLFVQVWDSAAKLPTVTSPKAYFIVALRRELIRRITKQRQFSDATPDEDSELSVEEQLIATQTDDSITESLARFINQLPPRQREIIFLKYYSSLSTEEIAEVMQLTSPSVYKLLYKALNNLRQLCSGWEAVWTFCCLTFSTLFTEFIN
ncbi:RNA polymerase sigma factor [Spirosoma foliorum]|uniref:Sigma-70 family RNA polymerase sigma factor n=1 Tax=Spirosoma foliorum TaxID=2710596 RepID=A0A7G5H134_9BACT|nr:sigma-70 family RNA polymerase sigma factor [Spirosoma foliorum]QMW04826.1 sigma-70 family RNA polymerase sigma factor [Spirosoma foliorum]